MNSITQTTTASLASENNDAFFAAFQQAHQTQQQETQNTVEQLQRMLQASQTTLAAAAEQNAAQAARIAFLERQNADKDALNAAEHQTTKETMESKDQLIQALQSELKEKIKENEFLSKSHELLIKLTPKTLEELSVECGNRPFKAALYRRNYHPTADQVMAQNHIKSEYSNR